MKKLLLLAAVLCVQGNVMDINAQTKGTKVKQKNKATEKQVKLEVAKTVKPVVIKNQMDSLAYTMGMAQTQGLRDYLTGKMEMDTAYFDDFIRGLKEVATSTDKKQNAYHLGILIGQQLNSQMLKGVNEEIFGKETTQSIDKDLYLEGFIAGTMGKGGIISVDAAQKYVQENMEKIKDKNLEQQYGANKEAGIKFLAENKTKEGVVTTASGLQYKIITKGTGEIPTADSKVKVHYKGTLLDGTEFDSSYKRNEPATFGAGQVIKGWTEALTLMPVGSKWELYIPYDLAYGSRDAGPIKPFSTLIFEVELLGIEK
ncbi:FKBP-type peptidyl-prolyl cis-trans isomerase FklB [Bacteroides luti]|jgi:FKBP-type peptidyl-prolyl cis-trans isomerases 1|uniref:Peptidyl-prolyl cis-trans isomerase n=1 Tax=Bacteroides luti TaxID=1297750 RepID=A0A1M4T800_9BACE|nr:FKBP-type peptidyl-prolyl cis-trans isomerase [Bacteroides luti]SHE40514.1 FKBP-type peptidyl-prolyl cis-trans isomerase FklB [Bacteroides luti]